MRGERWIEVRLAEEPIRIAYRVGFGAELAARERKSADADGDGEVSAAEGNAALDARTDALLGALRVCTGRSADALDCRALVRRDVERVEAEGWIPGPTGHLHFSWTLALRDAKSDLGAIRIEDGWQVDGIEVTDVGFDGASDLTAAGEGESPAGVAARFTWIESRRAPGPRTFSAAWPPPPERPWLVLLAAGLLMIGGAAIWLLGRRSGSPA
jgi:hypothetical protein